MKKKNRFFDEEKAKWDDNDFHKMTKDSIKIAGGLLALGVGVAVAKDLLD